MEMGEARDGDDPQEFCAFLLYKVDSHSEWRVPGWRERERRHMKKK